MPGTDDVFYSLFQYEAVAHTFKICDYDDDTESKLTIDGVDGDPFIFEMRELPEDFNWDYILKLNEIDYPDDYQTNQIIGAYLQPVAFNGTFFGPWYDGSDIKTAKERSDVLEKIFKQKKPIKIILGMGDHAGFKMVALISEYKRKIRNYYDLDYSIVFKHHQPQTRVKPKQSSQIQVAPDPAATQTRIDNATPPRRQPKPYNPRRRR